MTYNWFNTFLMINKRAKDIYRGLLFICAVYFIAVSIAHQMGVKIDELVRSQFFTQRHKGTKKGLL